MQHNNPLPTEILNLLPTLTPLQLAWLSGYAWSQASGVEQPLVGQHLAANLTALSAEPFSITVLSGSQTGNAKSVADKVAAELTEAGIAVKRVALKDYKAKTIADEKYLLLVTSTQGEGEPPEEGVVLHKLLNGKKAPKLTELQFAVLGLGDSSYPNFCQAGKDFDQRFAELGATRLFERVDADLDYSATAEQWIRDIVAIVKEKAAQASPVVQSIATATTALVAKESQYNKANPFPATLITNQKITGRQSDKDVRHLEFDLAGSDLHYQPGDALGVWFDNDPKLVDEILLLAQIDPTTEVTIERKTQTISTALLSHLELTQNTPAFVKGYAALAHNEQLNDLVADNQALQELVQRTPIVDVLHKFPAKLTAEQLVSLLRPLTPRLYSISSSPAEVGEEVHLTVGVVRFEHEGRARSGAASSFLADRVEEDGAVRVFVEHNDNFRLPNDTTKPIIMVGSGTGVAPFRAFMQQRVADEASGKNWLIFGIHLLPAISCIKPNGNNLPKRGSCINTILLGHAIKRRRSMCKIKFVKIRPPFGNGYKKALIFMSVVMHQKWQKMWNKHYSTSLLKKAI